MLNTDMKHVQKYVGDYALSDDFAFQETMRKLDITIKNSASKLLGKPKADAFFVNGWGQVLAAAYLLEQNPTNLKISEAFKAFVKCELDKAEAKCNGQINPFVNQNVRGLTKPILLHPTHPTHPGKFLDWKTVEIVEPIKHLNEFVKTAQLRIEIHEGKLYLKIYPENDNNIFNKLWKTDLPQLLENRGYSHIEKNKECPHLTLVNSEIWAKISDHFKNTPNYEGSRKFINFTLDLLKTLNTEFKEFGNPVQFTELSSTYSEDYTPFEEVIVAKGESKAVESVIKTFVNFVEKELGIQITLQPKSSFHLAIATKYRQPLNNPIEDVEKMMGETGKYSHTLQASWQQLK